MATPLTNKTTSDHPARDSAHALVSDLALDLAHASDLAFDLARSRNDDLVRRLDLARARVRALALDLDTDLDTDCYLDLLRNRVRALAHVVATAHAHNLARGLGLEPINAKAQQLAEAIDAALAERAQSSRVVTQVEGRKPSRTAVQMARCAVRVVPVGHRSRYDEEFQGELTQIAKNCRRGTQMLYAFRVLMHGLLLRRALRGVPPETPEQARSR